MAVKIRKVRPAFIIYWFLLAYIIAALVWWFIALNTQSEKLSDAKMGELRKDDPAYNLYSVRIEDERRRKTAQYAGEGITFLLLILTGAIFVFRAVRRELRTSASQRDFMIAVAHELKTPIAVTKLNLETLQKRRLDESRTRRLLENTLQEAERLNSLSSNMLLSSQMEANAYRMASEEINYSEFVSRIVAGMRARPDGARLHADIDADIFLTGDPFLLEIALNNIFENALKYSPKDAEVQIRVFRSGERVVTECADHGSGIPDAEKKAVFKKFHRIGNEATRKAKGTGLGLYLAGRITAAHDGTITIRDNPQGGSIFAVSLKANA